MNNKKWGRSANDSGEDAEKENIGIMKKAISFIFKGKSETNEIQGPEQGSTEKGVDVEESHKQRIENTPMPKYTNIEMELLNCQTSYALLLEISYLAVISNNIDRCEDLWTEWNEALTVNPLSTYHMLQSFEVITKPLTNKPGEKACKKVKEWIDLLQEHNLKRYPYDTIVLSNSRKRSMFSNGIDHTLGEEVSIKMRPWFLINNDGDEIVLAKGMISTDNQKYQ